MTDGGIITYVRNAMTKRPRRAASVPDSPR
jgi:hypothetical protein